LNYIINHCNRGLTFPRIYDPLASEKRQIHNEVTKVLAEHGFDHTHVFADGTRVKVLAHYCYRPDRKKDLDNMSKFLLDALEMAMYADDDDIFDMHVTKERSANPRTMFTIMHD
jgi:Holliday junction resolvase RusA-like endonuclease